MTSNIEHEIHNNLVKERPGRLDYVKEAFTTLPKIEKPIILDIGCGSGEPTMELARLSGGLVTGVDISKSALVEFENKVSKLDIKDKITISNMSMLDLDFPKEHFDIIWSEGSIFAIGFEKGLKEWRKLIKPNGYLVVHEMCWINLDPPQDIQAHMHNMYPGIKTHQENIEIIPKCGYKEIKSFTLPEDVWETIYFSPLDERVQSLKKKYNDDPKALAILDKELIEIEMYRKYSKWYGSAYYIMQKIE